MSTVELKFAAHPGHVRTARMIAMAVGKRAGVPAEAIDEIKLAVAEACARAVRANRRHSPPALVRMRLVDTPDTFTVAVSDLGTPDGDQPEPVSLTALAALGYGTPDEAGPADGIGLALIEGLVDEMEITPGDGGAGTVVTMRWHTKPKSDQR
jgi:anti-sigma regulatory factor (Ser/Thr protein kinase)